MRLLLIIILIVVGFFLSASLALCLGVTQDYYEVPTVTNELEEFDAVTELVGNDFGGPMLLVLFLFLFGWLFGLYRSVCRKKRTASIKGIGTVEKPFILYLRSFADEKSTKKKVKRLFDSRSEEEMLIDAFSDIAPVYAIGDPADKRMPYGATRIYVDDSIWKQTVENLAMSAEVVILRLGQTNNFWWEVNMALKKVPIEKIVFVIPWSKNSENVQTLHKILSDHGIDISSLNLRFDKKRYGSISSVLFFKNNTPVNEEIVIPRFTGLFLSYDNLLRNALSSFREKYGFNDKKRLPVFKARIMTLVLILTITFVGTGKFMSHLAELKIKRKDALREYIKETNTPSGKYVEIHSNQNL